MVDCLIQQRSVVWRRSLPRRSFCSPELTAHALRDVDGFQAQQGMWIAAGTGSKALADWNPYVELTVEGNRCSNVDHCAMADIDT
ncbi:MAG: hypothetical protein EA416_12255 [Trueperaceae bacterium]|nr:MAG: hypothetical protein EA416_12255 [Trueperaceae bacterium]